MIHLTLLCENIVLTSNIVGRFGLNLRLGGISPFLTRS
jgi:hypothetical protein